MQSALNNRLFLQAFSHFRVRKCGIMHQNSMLRLIYLSTVVDTVRLCLQPLRFCCPLSTGFRPVYAKHMNQSLQSLKPKTNIKAGRGMECVKCHGPGPAKAAHVATPPYAVYSSLILHSRRHFKRPRLYCLVLCKQHLPRHYIVI